MNRLMAVNVYHDHMFYNIVKHAGKPIVSVVEIYTCAAKAANSI